MFKQIENKEVRHFRVKGKELWIKYRDEEEQYLTKGKVNLKNFFNTQRIYYDKAQSETYAKAELRNSQNKKKDKEVGQPYWLELKKIAVNRPSPRVI